MSMDERRQWQMDFILDQQAQFTTDIQHLKELHVQAEKRTDRLERVVKLMIRAGRRERREWRERYTALVDSQIQTEEITRRNSEAIARNSIAINQLTEIVRQLATRGNSNGAEAREQS